MLSLATPWAFGIRNVHAHRLPWAIASAHGFTAIELMVVVAIVAILAALAAPSFTPLIERWRVRSAVEGLQSALYFARSEAIKRGGRVVIQKLPNGTNGCSAPNGADWNCGWFICEDTNGNNSCATSEPVLQRFDAPVKLDITRTGNGASIAFDRWRMPARWFGFSLLPESKTTTNPAARGLCMSAAGRIRVIPPEDIPCRSTSN
ncbi:GspH/FimT family pseudopilin [Ottowia sp.]|uniref:GspH/FimT family pseudopilin n=1 Tax=Ottowia sp. TaxID=1898956 RepID=UPI0039E63C2F